MADIVQEPGAVGHPQIPSFHSSRKDFSASGGRSRVLVQALSGPGSGLTEPSRTAGFCATPAGLRAGLVEGGTFHGLLEALEHQALRPAREPLLDLAVPELEEEVVQRYADGTGLPARAAREEAWGRSFASSLPFRSGVMTAPIGPEYVEP